MIEKRKNNLKEEIENSEKKARKTATEVVEEEEEAENIPESNEETHAEEHLTREDFENENKENGYLVEGEFFYFSSKGILFRMGIKCKRSI